MKVAITGASGFVGSHLLEALRKEKIIFATFNPKKHDLFRPETLRGLVKDKDVVIHLAGVNRDSDVSNIMKVNVLGTKGLLDAMLLYAPTAKIVFISSFQAYLEDNIYGASKRNAEELIESYVHRSQLTAIILRFTNMYGPGCKPFYNSVIATFSHQIRKGKSIVINGDGSQKRDYLYVTDGVDAIYKALSYTPQKVMYFDICSGTQTSLNEVLLMLQKYASKKVIVRYNKEVEASDWGLRKNYQKAKQILGWEPKVSIEKGLQMLMKESE